MRDGLLVLLMVGVTMSASLFAQDAVQLSGQTVELGPEPETTSVVIRHPYFDAYLGRNLVDEPPALPELAADDQFRPMLTRLEMAGPWLKLLEKGEAEEYWERNECDSGEPSRVRLCGVRWRKSGGFSDLRYRLGEVSKTMKAKFVGEALSEHLEVDIDSSPEIKFQWEWD